jgi:hypothetical protein
MKTRVYEEYGARRLIDMVGELRTWIGQWLAPGMLEANHLVDKEASTYHKDIDPSILQRFHRKIMRLGSIELDYSLQVSTSTQYQHTSLLVNEQMNSVFKPRS